MEYIYGSLMPVRVLEEIVFWKKQEREHIEVILAIVPQLEPEYVQVLREWEPVFTKTEEAASAWLEFILSQGEARLPIRCTRSSCCSRHPSINPSSS